MNAILKTLVADSCQTLQSLLAQADQFDAIAAAAVTTLCAGGKLLTCGNGGSAADALHLAEELVGRYHHNRRSLPAVCLNADPTLLTCIANDFGYDEVFARQVEGLAEKRDLLVCFTTSGNSPNVVRALAAAKAKGAKTVAFLGKDGGKCKGLADLELIVASRDTARVQEAHTLLLHALLEVIERDVLGPVTTTPPAPTRPVATMRQVLVVEDDLELARTLEEVLTFENCTVDIAANGQEGLEKLRGAGYDAVICDLLMPQLDGELFYREAAKLYPYMADRFIFITGQITRRVGLTDFIYRTGNTLLEKPFEMEQMRAALRDVFAR